MRYSSTIRLSEALLTLGTPGLSDSRFTCSRHSCDEEAALTNPLSDDLGTRWANGKNPSKPKKPQKELKEPVVHYTELDDEYWRAREIYGRQDG